MFHVEHLSLGSPRCSPPMFHVEHWRMSTQNGDIAKRLTWAGLSGRIPLCRNDLEERFGEVQETLGTRV